VCHQNEGTPRHQVSGGCLEALSSGYNDGSFSVLLAGSGKPLGLARWWNLFAQTHRGTHTHTHKHTHAYTRTYTEKERHGNMAVLYEIPRLPFNMDTFAWLSEMMRSAAERYGPSQHSGPFPAGER